MSTKRFRIVLDTNQIVSAGSGWLEQPRPVPDPNICRRVLIRVAESHTGLYCGKIIAEYLEKLIDLKHSPERALRLVTYIMGAFQAVAISTNKATFQPSDPEDEVFLLCAIDGQADFLISEDRDLLDLKPLYATPVIGRSTEIAPILGA